MSKKIKLTISFIMIALVLIFSANIVKAASSATITAKEEYTVGDSITVTLKYTAAAWDLHVSSELSTSSTTDFASATDDAKNATFSKTITYQATKAGDYTIKLTGTVSDENDAASSSGKSIDTAISVKVKEKEKETTTDKEQNEEKPSNNENNTTTVTEPKFTKTNKTVYAKKEINLRASWSTSSQATTIDKGTELTLTGTSTERIDAYVWYRVTYKGETKYVASTLITTEKPEEEEEEKSDDNSLKSLKATPSGLIPNFDSETKNYTLTIGSDIDDVEIDAIATDKNAEVKISGNKDLEIGQNTIKIVVTAEDGTERTYKIVVTKEDEEQLGLKELLIEGVSLSPEFKENVYNYTVELEDTETKELNITATATRKDAEVEIVGNNDLKVGDNTITIMVKADDDDEVVTYQITVTIKDTSTETSAPVVEENSSNNDLKKYVVIGAGVLIIIAIIVIIISKREEAVEESIEEPELEPLADEDLPKSLRKNKKEESNDKEVELPVEKDLKDKIDELMSEETDTEEKRATKKGKRFK